MGSAAVVESQLARERVDYLDLLIHGQYVVLVVMTVPCFRASESTIALSPCMPFFIVFLIAFYYHAIKTF